MKISRSLSAFMIAALLFVVFHDFAVNTAETTHHNSFTSTQSSDIEHTTYTVAVEHQSFHQPFLITSSDSSFYTPSDDAAHHDDETDHSQDHAFTIFSPPKV